MSWRYTRGSVSVEMDGGLERMIRRALDSEPIIDALEEELRIIRSDIDAEWPVATGESLAGWRLFIAVGQGAIMARVTNVVDYHRYVKGKTHGGKSSVRATVTRPAMARVRALVKRMERNWKRRVEGN